MFSYWLKKNWYYHRTLSSFYKRSIEPEKRVLQIECRNGYLLSAVGAAYGVGIDASAEHIAEARAAYPQYTFFVGSLFDAAVYEQFDYIILSSMLMEMHDIQKFFDAIKPFCHDKTRIIVDSYAIGWIPFLWLAQKIGLRRPTTFKHWVLQEDIKNFFALSDYEVVSQGRFMLLPFYVPFFSIIFNRLIAHIPGINALCLNQYIVARKKPAPQSIDSYSVSVIIPCKNEQGNIRNAVIRTPGMGLSTELIFVEGGSVDDTYAEIQRVAEEFPEKNIRYYKQEGSGKKGAVHTGFAQATGDICIILDADLTVPPEELPKFIEVLASGKGELVNGSRLVYGMESGAMHFFAVIANWIFSLLVSFVLKQKVKDTLCGTKIVFKKDYIRICERAKNLSVFDPFGDFELLFGAAQLHLAIKDVPVHYKSREYGTSQISQVKGGLMLAYVVLHGFWYLRSDQ